MKVYMYALNFLNRYRLYLSPVEVPLFIESEGYFLFLCIYIYCLFLRILWNIILYTIYIFKIYIFSILFCDP